MGPVTRVVQTGIGLVAEVRAAKAEHKASKSVTQVEASTITPPSSSTEQIEEPPPDLVPLQIDEKHGLHEDEEEVDDDENFGGAAPPLYEDDSNLSPERSVESPPPYPEQGSPGTREVGFPKPAGKVTASKLSCPVIIPQRRPGSKIRGFVRAYAPALADFDIDQDAFLDFLKSFHKASQASPTLAVITVGAGALGNVPEPGSMLVGLGLSLMGGTAMEIQSRHRANAYLDKANEELFKPRGLFCLVMSFRPDDVPKGEVALEDVDTSKEALKWLTPPKSAMRAKTSKLRVSSGKTRGEDALPESAPLIYPDIGYAELAKEAKPDSEAKKDSFSTRKVVQEYFDKRAQAKYAYDHPDSALAVESTPKFASKYGDPTHPSVTTNYVGRVSSAMGRETVEERQARKRAKAMQARSSGGKIRRVLQTSVLYLMIVNMPSEEQMAEAILAARADPSRVGSDLASTKSE